MMRNKIGIKRLALSLLLAFLAAFNLLLIFLLFFSHLSLAEICYEPALIFDRDRYRITKAAEESFPNFQAPVLWSAMFCRNEQGHGYSIMVVESEPGQKLASKSTIRTSKFNLIVTKEWMGEQNATADKLFYIVQFDIPKSHRRMTIGSPIFLKSSITDSIKMIVENETDQLIRNFIDALN